MVTQIVRDDSVEQSGTLSADQTNGILEALPEAVAEFDCDQTITCVYANGAFVKLVKKNRSKVVGSALSDLFADVKDSKRLASLLETAQSTKRDKPSILKLRNRSFQVKCTWHENKILVLFSDVSPLSDKLKDLQKQARELGRQIAAASEGNPDLDWEITALRQRLRAVEKNSTFDIVSGFHKRIPFLDRAAAEFQRCTRYQHALSLAIVQIRDLDGFSEKYGADACDQAVTALGQFVETSYRAGVDVAGRISDDQIGLLLPETAMSGAMNFVQRLKQLVETSPVFINQSTLTLSLNVSVESILENDHTVLQPLNRCLAGLG